MASVSPQLQKLLTLASNPIAEGQAIVEFSKSSRSKILEAELGNLLAERNGFFAFEYALRVFPAQTTQTSFGLADWNSRNLWKDEYSGMADKLLCFAEDIFGNQFAILEDKIVHFAVETGISSQFSNSLEEWAEKLVSDYDFVVGYTFARNWQKANRNLLGRERLFPITPFNVGGAYNIQNMRANAGDQVMRVFGEFARSIQTYPDGTRIRLSP